MMRNKEIQKCSVEGCSRTVSTKGLCFNCYMKERARKRRIEFLELREFARKMKEQEVTNESK